MTTGLRPDKTLSNRDYPRGYEVELSDRRWKNLGANHGEFTPLN
jgi:hypothetical protein